MPTGVWGACGGESGGFPLIRRFSFGGAAGGRRAFEARNFFHWFARAWARFSTARDRARRWDANGASRLMARRSPTKHIKNFRPSRLRHSAQRNSSRLGIGGVSMKTAAHYRAMAEECIKWAGEAYTAEVRESYLQLARIWLDTASRLNGLSTGEAAPEEPITAVRAVD